jgi:hypothetical protein
MKKLLFLAFASIALLSCSDDPSEKPLEAKFEVTVTGEAPNALISIANTSVGASTYQWSFGKGFSVETSDAQIPSGVKADKTGTLDITLKVVNGSKTNEITKQVTVTGNNGVLSFTDVAFALNSTSTEFGQFFSVESGQVLKASQVTAAIAPKINLAFGSMSNTMYYFESPSDRTEIANGSVSKVINYESTPTITTAKFDLMADDRDLKGLTITDTNDSFPNSRIPGTVLFQIADGRKGVIKTKAVNSSRLLVDIKIQKY